MDHQNYIFFGIDEKKRKKFQGISVSNKTFVYSFSQGFFEVEEEQRFSGKRKFYFGYQQAPFQFFMIKEMEILITFSFGGKIKIWEKLSKRVLRTFYLKGEKIKKIAAQRGIKFSLVICPGKIYLWNFITGNPIMVIPFASPLNFFLSFLPSGESFIIEGRDRTLNFFSLKKKFFFRKVKMNEDLGFFGFYPYSPFNLIFYKQGYIFEFNLDGRLESIFFLDIFHLNRKKIFNFLELISSLKILQSDFFFYSLDFFLFEKIWHKKTRLLLF